MLTRVSMRARERERERERERKNLKTLKNFKRLLKARKNIDICI